MSEYKWIIFNVCITYNCHEADLETLKRPHGRYKKELIFDKATDALFICSSKSLIF